MFVVIPAYRPDEKLFGVIDGLREEGVRFVVVDDGSGIEYAPVFMRLEDEYSDCVTVIRYNLNCGKGHALKEAFAHIGEICKDDDGILTIDDDWIHMTEGAREVIKTWEANRESFVLGSRRYLGRIPFRSKLGDAITRSVFSTTSGARLSDPQTGMRAFSARLIPELIKISGERFDYEIAQLLFAAKEHINIIEVPLETPFATGHRSVHFIRFKDSWLIFRMIFIFMLSSFSCFVIDYSLLLILSAVLNNSHSAVRTSPGTFCVPLFGTLVDTHMIALVIARAVSSFCNFLLNRKVVFKTGSRSAIFRFYTVIIGLLLANYGLLALVTRSTGGFPLWIAQLIVQAVLYPISFILQRKFVFPDRDKNR
ncbi:MAG: GtrA family protein [Clostridiales bacterium]|nr:GtrA family protein [Clostridiales bacterium]